MKKTLLLLALSAILASCNNNNKKADGYGNFEATEITVSSEANGKLVQFTITEGTPLTQGAVVGYVDTIQLYLKKQQLLVARENVASRSASVLSQINVIKEQQKNLQKDKDRIKNLLKDNAATPKQMDDINGQLNVLQQQIKSIETQNLPVMNELKNLDVQLQQLNDQIQKSIILNPINGTVLAKYAEQNEITTFGKPLYKIAMLDEMLLRVYVSETQLPALKTGDKVKVKIDEGKSTTQLEGVITWISSTAEFTPKIIQTKEERVNLVYAVKVSVKNDGRLKIGMPGEMWLK